MVKDVELQVHHPPSAEGLGHQLGPGRVPRRERVLRQGPEAQAEREYLSTSKLPIEPLVILLVFLNRSLS